jgi:hypothetical protein
MYTLETLESMRAHADRAFQGAAAPHGLAPRDLPRRSTLRDFVRKVRETG